MLSDPVYSVQSLAKVSLNDVERSRFVTQFRAEVDVSKYPRVRVGPPSAKRKSSPTIDTTSRAKKPCITYGGQSSQSLGVPIDDSHLRSEVWRVVNDLCDHHKRVREEQRVAERQGIEVEKQWSEVEELLEVAAQECSDLRNQLTALKKEKDRENAHAKSELEKKTSNWQAEKAALEKDQNREINELKIELKLKESE